MFSRGKSKNSSLRQPKLPAESAFGDFLVRVFCYMKESLRRRGGKPAAASLSESSCSAESNEYPSAVPYLTNILTVRRYEKIRKLERKN